MMLGVLVVRASPAAGLTLPTDPPIAVGGWLDGLAVADTGGGVFQRPQGRAALRFEALPTRRLRGVLELQTRIGGPFEGGHQGVYDFVHTFQNYSPALELGEAYLDVHTSRVDVRAGIQRIAWGALDGVPPTDVLDPRDYHDPFVDAVEERKIGSPALLATYYPPAPGIGLDQLHITLVYLPFAVPSRLALLQERWFPSTARPPASFHVPAASLPENIRPSFPDGLTLPVQFGTANQRPPQGLADGGIALRMGATWLGADWNVYHYTGPETGPNAALLAEVTTRPKAGFLISSSLRQRTSRIHMTGADWSFATGNLTLRAEAAHFIDKPYLRLSSDLVAEATTPAVVGRVIQRLLATGRASVPLGALFPRFDSVEWGVGADYLIRGFLPLFQINQIFVLEPTPRLLIGRPETRLTALVRKRILDDRLELEFRGVYEIERGGWFLFPRVSYLLRDDLLVRVGYLGIGGPRTSLYGQFGDNDEVVLQVRHTF